MAFSGLATLHSFNYFPLEKSELLELGVRIRLRCEESWCFAFTCWYIRERRRKEITISVWSARELFKGSIPS